MDDWAERIGEYKPKLTVDTSRITPPDVDSYYTNKVLARHVYEEAETANNRTNRGNEIARVLREFYKDCMERSFNEIASNTKRQADKAEKTVVQIGNKTVTDAVITQRNADGYSFI